MKKDCCSSSPCHSCESRNLYRWIPHQVRDDNVKPGFTFVELLVVITIIAVLTAAAAVSYSTINTKSRDARRKADIELIRSALELCRTESGSYPTSIYSPDNITCDSVVYLSSTPKDPKDGSVYTYSRPSATSYTLSCTLEGAGSCSFTNP